MRLRTMWIAGAILIATIGAAMAQDRIRISSEWGSVTAELADNAATAALLGMLPLTIPMSDHLRQEKTGSLPSGLPAAARQRTFKNGTIGLWGPDHFVVYYRDGQVPQPGIVILGEVQGGASIFDRPGTVSLRIELVR
ncbi:MAG TPA: cyclophilin-like fold protein [Bosea sp. (in: a-proteobacteria)]|uniref:cyclophilin-like fold protein n=1 Tax=Bosea sp. (in: a-proteobacteria) TaxID=1871050 RepID=UPI002DDCA944|nr:cyclophilin-like fold protein [Bosea sp. (in: a-proteobacteria)]HEV2554508.1 cyclophilin-like fold protein [Bosea sp. (in: a-proteobacteria)]